MKKLTEATLGFICGGYAILVSSESKVFGAVSELRRAMLFLDVSGRDGVNFGGRHGSGEARKLLL